MVSDSDLIDRLREFLKGSDLNTTTTAIVRRRLEEDFGIDLSEKKKFIREQVDLYLQSQFENDEEEEQGEGDDNGEDDPTAKVKSEETDVSDSNEEGENERARNRRAHVKKRSKRVSNDIKRRGGGINKVCSLSPKLQEIVGFPALARTEVVKQIWVYIRERNLQDPDNKKNIICDEALHALFGVDSIDMFQMNKALSEHIRPLSSDEIKLIQKEKQRKQEIEEVVSVNSIEKEEQRKHEREEGVADPDELKRKEKRQKGFLAPRQLSDALVKFLGTGESMLTRADVIKRMWDYIKENNLQDPSDKRNVICDEKLKELFDVDNFNGFTVTKLLVAHFLKT